MTSLYLLIHLFILLFNKYLYNTCHVPGPVPNAGVKLVNKVDSLVDRDKHKTTSQIITGFDKSCEAGAQRKGSDQRAYLICRVREGQLQEVTSR